MMRCKVMAALTLTLLVPSIAGAVEKPTYFAVKLGDKLIGYAVVSSDTVTRDATKLTRIKSETVLKVALLGKQRDVVLRSETLLDAKTGRPVSYHLTSRTDDVVDCVDSQFGTGDVRTWSYRKGDERGTPVETKLPEGNVVILGSNNFAHWQRLLDKAAEIVANGKANLTVFVPEMKQTDHFEMSRDEPTEMNVAGVRRKVVVWHLAKAQMELVADAATGEFLRMDLPAQKTTVAVTDDRVVKLMEKARAEELLAGHFIQSNVAFDDFLKVTHLEATVDVQVIGSGLDNDVSVLTTGMQKFEGDKTAGHIAGKVTVVSKAYDGHDSPAFAGIEPARDISKWLAPSTCIESDDKTIVAKAAELTRGAKTRWEAVLEIGRWVHKEIAYTIADTPSARLALEKKKGDCGPHSTLTIALLRAAKIPARLVGGVVYTPSFGGSFGQHAWVEVFMGSAGWIAFDPTTGEFERMSATHIKLFEGMGGVQPKTIKVTRYEPANQAVVAVPLAQARPLAWKLGKPYTFTYRKGDKELGAETFTLTKKEQDDVTVLRLADDVKLKINMLSSLTSHTEIVATLNARPKTFQREFSVLLTKTKVDCIFSEQSVQVEISGSKSLSREIKLPENVYCFDNNLMGCWVLICAQLQLEPGKPITIRTFHPSSLRIIPLTITPKAPAAIKIGGKEVDCFECEIAPIKNAFWITRDGRFVRARQGDLVIELKEAD